MLSNRWWTTRNGGKLGPASGTRTDERGLSSCLDRQIKEASAALKRSSAAPSRERLHYLVVEGLLGMPNSTRNPIRLSKLESPEMAIGMTSPAFVSMALAAVRRSV